MKQTDQQVHVDLLPVSLERSDLIEIWNDVRVFIGIFEVENQSDQGDFDNAEQFIIFSLFFFSGGLFLQQVIYQRNEFFVKFVVYLQKIVNTYFYLFTL